MGHKFPLLGFVGLIVALLALICSFFVPEVRQVLRLERPPEQPQGSQTGAPVQAERRVSIKGNVLRIDLPEWAPDPARGSISFNKDDEIAQMRELTAHLTVRDETAAQWQESDPILVLRLLPGERLCSIVPAEHNTRNFYLGFQAHCASSDACSYNIEGKRLWATIGNVEVILAPQGVQCPSS